MAISGLIITWPDDATRAAAARLAVAGDPRFELGPAEGHRQVAVLDTPDPRGDREAIAWLLGTAGVVHADVVCVHLDDAPPPTARAAEPGPACLATSGGTPS